MQDLSFRIERGQCFGLLGPNGAGKTTTISVIVGAVKATAGQVLINGRALNGEADSLKRSIGFVPQELALYEELSARDNLQFFGAIYALSGAPLQGRIRQALATVGLAERAEHIVGTFSGGMKRRLNIAAALLHEPQLLILDEPTVGVDPQSRNAIFDNVQALNRAGVTVLYTTHYMEEVERLCDHVAIMDGGKLVANNTLPGLYSLLPVKNRLFIDLAASDGSAASVLPETALTALRELPGVKAAELHNGRLRLDLNDLAADTPGALQCLAQHHHTYKGIASEQVGLEEVFLHLTGRNLRDA